MCKPKRAVEFFDKNTFIEETGIGRITLSTKLVDILLNSRQNYDWPSGTGTRRSQEIIILLENTIKEILISLTAEQACQIISRASAWGGNNKSAQLQIENAPAFIQRDMKKCILELLCGCQIKNALYNLSQLPGIGLVMASKVYRFCCPNVGVAVDRHSSFFFNSLPLLMLSGQQKYATNFKREWATGKHTTSRLAIYQNSNLLYNLNEYLNSYLPLLNRIASYLNNNGVTYLCPVSNENKTWRATDVEMAAYYWWSQNGPM
jgi:hypothetical protein